jgi:hypothetical protein
MRILAAVFLLSVINLSAAAQNKQVVPILDLGVNCLLGGAEKGKWYKAEQVFPLISEAEGSYKLLDSLGEREEAVLYKKPKSNKDEPICTDTYSLEDVNPNDVGLAVGTKAGWSLVPRPIQNLDIKNETYLKIVRDFARSKGIAAPKIGEVSFSKVDLEGDGVDEVVIAATYYKNGLTASAAVGDYSFVLLRKVVNGAAQNILITGDFHKKAVQFGAPGHFNVTTIADLNGDEKMEIVTHGKYYEGAWTDVYEINGAKLTKVLDCACGV